MSFLLVGIELRSGLYEIAMKVKQAEYQCLSKLTENTPIQCIWHRRLKHAAPNTIYK